MAEIFIITVAVGSILGLIYTSFKIRQISKFSDFLHDKIDELYSSNEWRTTDINICESYNRLGRSLPWNTKFDTMVVYDKVC